MILNGTSFKGNDVFKGYCADLAREIANIISFNYVISPVKDGSFGRKGEDGTWNGMVGELIRHVSILHSIVILFRQSICFSHLCSAWILSLATYERAGTL